MNWAKAARVCDNKMKNVHFTITFVVHMWQWLKTHLHTTTQHTHTHTAIHTHTIFNHIPYPTFAMKTLNTNDERQHRMWWLSGISSDCSRNVSLPHCVIAICNLTWLDKASLAANHLIWTHSLRIFFIFYFCRGEKKEILVRNHMTFAQETLHVCNQATADKV